MGALLLLKKIQRRKTVGLNVTKEIKEVGKIIGIYAQPSVGKTTMAAQAVKDAGDAGIFISCGENGLSLNQKDTTFADITNINQHQDVVEYLDRVNVACPKCGIAHFDQEGAAILHGSGGVCPTCQENQVSFDGVGLYQLLLELKNTAFKCIAIDSLNFLFSTGGPVDNYCFNKHFLNGNYKTPQKAHDAAYNYGGSAITAEMGKELLNKVIKPMLELSEKGVDIIITMHEHKVKVEDSLTGEKYEKVSPYLPSVGNTNLASDLVARLSHCIYGVKKVNVVENGDTGKKRGTGGKERVAMCDGDASFYAKWRGGANPGEIPFSWDEVKKYF